MSGMLKTNANLLWQIRIVTDTHDEGDNDKQKKKKKKTHRGYAFVVYEREKDMKGIATFPDPDP